MEVNNSFSLHTSSLGKTVNSPALWGSGAVAAAAWVAMAWETLSRRMLRQRTTSNSCGQITLMTVSVRVYCPTMQRTYGTCAAKPRKRQIIYKIKRRFTTAWQRLMKVHLVSWWERKLKLEIQNEERWPHVSQKAARELTSCSWAGDLSLACLPFSWYLWNLRILQSIDMCKHSHADNGFKNIHLFFILYSSFFIYILHSSLLFYTQSTRGKSWSFVMNLVTNLH